MDEIVRKTRSIYSGLKEESLKPLRICKTIFFTGLQWKTHVEVGGTPEMLAWVVVQSKVGSTATLEYSQACGNFAWNKRELTGMLHICWGWSQCTFYLINSRSDGNYCLLQIFGCHSTDADLKYHLRLIFKVLKHILEMFAHTCFCARTHVIVGSHVCAYTLVVRVLKLAYATDEKTFNRARTLP